MGSGNLASLLSDLTAARQLGNLVQIELDPATHGKPPSQGNPKGVQVQPQEDMSPLNAAVNSAVPGMNRNISGCLELEEMPGQDLGAAENREKQKSF